MPQNSSKRVPICLGVCFTIIIGLVIAVIVLATKECNNKDVTKTKTPQESQTSPDLLELFNVNDGMEITWLPSATNISDVKNAIRDNMNVVEVNLLFQSGKWYTKDKQTSVDEVLNVVKSSSTILKLNVKQSMDMTSDITDLIENVVRTKLQKTTIITVPIFSSMFDWDTFLAKDRKQRDNIVFNFDLTTECCQAPIGRGVIEKVNFLYQQMKSSCTVEINVQSIPTSWNDIRWLLEASNHLSLLVSRVEPDNIHDALMARNDLNKDRVFYNVGGTIYNGIKMAASAAGSALLYFDINPRDAGKIIWSHNTDTWEQIHAATSGDVMMIEGDIQVLGQGTTNITDIPIMGHDIGDYNNFTFEQWLDEIIKVNKGMKFDFKSIEAVRPALQITKTKLEQIKGPIWLNADIVRGPSAGAPRIPKEEFLAAAKEFGASTLSLGWTTVRKGENYNLKYTMGMIKEMHEITKNLHQPITFPVRAEQLKYSLPEFHWLLSQSRDYTLTVWTSHGDNVTKSDMDFVKRQNEASRIYFDLPIDLRPTL